MFKLYSVLILFFTISTVLNSQIRFTNEQKAKTLIKRMTLDEKIGQMNQYIEFWDMTGPAPSEEDAKKKLEHLKSGMLGSMLYAVNKNLVLVLMNGRPLNLVWAKEKIPAILEAWQPGTQGDNPFAQVLYGEYNPVEKLPMTFPRSVGQVPIYYNHKPTGRPILENEVCWTHYSDESNEPLFPFGFGLSYTNFEYSDLKVAKMGKQKFEFSVTIKNSGKYNGEEEVQLYLTDKVSSFTQPVKELKAFKKIKIETGKSLGIKFMLIKDELGFYNNGIFKFEPGEFAIMLGGSSAEGMKSGFSIE